jgi:glutamate transport system permease protein
VVALIFIAVNFLLTTFAGWLEGRLRQRKKGTGAVLTAGPVDEMETGVPERGTRLVP